MKQTIITAPYLYYALVVITWSLASPVLAKAIKAWLDIWLNR